MPVAQAITREVPPNVPQPSERFAKQSSILRKIAATDFICDPDGHSIRWHYERRDRPYVKTISWRTFENWSLLDDWTTRREGHWEIIEQRVREHMADEILRRRIQNLEFLERVLEGLDRYLEPLVDPKTGEPALDSDGLPKYPLKMPDMDKFITSYLKLHERVMLLRGEATTRSEQLRPLGSGGDDERPLSVNLRDRAITPKLSRDDARALARAMLRARNDKTSVGAEDGDADGSDDQHESLSEGKAVGGHEGSG